MNLRRTSLALVTATAVALSVLPSAAGAEEGTDPSNNFTAEADVDQWPGSAEGSSMLLDGQLPTAPGFGSSERDTAKDEEEEGGGKLVNENGDIPVIGSISLPGWVAIPIGVIQAVMVVTTFAAQAAAVVLPLMPGGTQMLREWLISVGINPDA